MMTIVTVGSYDGATSHTFTAAAVMFDRRVPAVAFADLPWRALARNPPVDMPKASVQRPASASTSKPSANRNGRAFARPPSGHP